MWNIYISAGLVILALMVLLWLLSLRLQDASIVDVFWGLGFVITAWLFFALTPEGYPIRKGVLCLLVTLWGLRLSLYIFFRNRGRGEDFRYRRWREEGGDKWWWQSFFKVFLLQGALLWLISAPLLAAQLNPLSSRLTWLDIAGLIVWMIGFFFEAAGDWQLARFKANPANRGKVFSGGVWRYTRHPNYFGDAAQWWGYFLFALAAGGWWSFFSPLLMTFLLVRVSGVTLLEKSLLNSKPGYQEYVKTTSAFIPWLPRKQKRPKGF